MTKVNKKIDFHTLEATNEKSVTNSKRFNHHFGRPSGFEKGLEKKDSGKKGQSKGKEKTNTKERRDVAEKKAVARRIVRIRDPREKGK